MSSAITLPNLLARADELRPFFRSRTAHLPREPKGIRQSEMFFLYAAVASLKPRRFLESGRARAQSTLVLASLFPDSEIISIEFDKNSPDVPVAAQRLAPMKNVRCLFGDSRVLLPKLLEPGDVLLIDGPKDFRALKLALRLLETGKPAAVFVHDMWLGLPVRRFVDRHLPAAFCSDEPEWVRRYASLDSGDSVAAAASRTAERRPYGATFACLPGRSENYARRLRALVLFQAAARLAELLGRSPVARPAGLG